MDVRSRWLILAAMGVIAGCGDIPNPLGGGDGGTPEPKWSSLYATYLQGCANCHAPGAPGRTSDTETTLDFSTSAKGYQTVTTGMAAGLVGNQAACNGVAFISAGHPAQSL